MYVFYTNLIQKRVKRASARLGDQVASTESQATSVVSYVLRMNPCIRPFYATALCQSNGLQNDL